MLKRISNEYLTITDNCLIMQFHHTQNKVMHAHGCFEMIYVMSGSALHCIESENGALSRHKLSIGNYLILNKHTRHGFEDVSPDFKVINFLFFPSLIFDDLDESSTFQDIITHPRLGISVEDLTALPLNIQLYDKDERIHSLFSNALSDYKQGELGTDIMLRSYARQILILALRQSSTNSSSGQIDETIRQICEYVKTEYSKPITLTELCKRMHFNVSYISKKFKRIYGTSFETHLQQTRIKKACELLIATNMSISEISGKVGYTNVNSFRKLFGKLIGTTPSEFRRLYSK